MRLLSGLCILIIGALSIIATVSGIRILFETFATYVMQMIK